VALEKYQQDLEKALSVIEHEVKTIADANAKSTRHVCSDLHMAPKISMKSHSKKSVWNTFCWKKSQEKENDGTGKLFQIQTMCRLTVMKGKKVKTYYQT
jgi:hypothetical protein